MPANRITIGIAGIGLIGASWAAYFSAHGYRVHTWDIASNSESRMRDFLPKASNIVPGALPVEQRGFVSFHTEKDAMVEGCALIIENGPENNEIKINLLAELDAITKPGVIIGSSTSSLLLSEITKNCVNKDRIIIAHPFNPPHLIPLVELFGPHAPTIKKAANLFLSLGKRPVILKKEIVGHIANRLTSAVFREALYLIEQNVASVEDIDTCITEGPGIRWAFLGPFMGYHLGGGEGGIGNYLEHLGPSQKERWKSHGTPIMTKVLVDRVIAEVISATCGQQIPHLMKKRDKMLSKLLKLKGYNNAPPAND